MTNHHPAHVYCQAVTSRRERPRGVGALGIMGLFASLSVVSPSLAFAAEEGLGGSVAKIPVPSKAPPVPDTSSLGAPTWSDEFDYTGAPDPTKWGYEVGFIRNGEKQYFTNDRRENARVEGGNLVITARKEDFQENGKSAIYTSASMTTRKTQAFIYGTFEIRAKFTSGRGNWPSIWFLGNDEDPLGWPTCGEIDLMEHVGYEPSMLHFTIHTKKYNHAARTAMGKSVQLPEVANTWHTFILQRNAHRLDMYFNGNPVFSYENDGTGTDAWPYDKPFHFITNVAIGGAWGGLKGIDDTTLPHTMDIDYVRYWKSDR